jgi:hypothetical protein
MNRTDVYKLIDGERAYQEDLSSDRSDGVDRTVGDYITMMGYYYNEMVKQWTMNPGNEEALNVMRKIAGIAVHCMEDHGAPPRKGYEHQPEALCPCCSYPECGHDHKVKKTKKKKKDGEFDTRWPFPVK